PAILQSGPITSPSQSRSEAITPPPISQSSRQITTNPPGWTPEHSSSSYVTPPSQPVSSPPKESDIVQPPKRGISRRAVLLGLTSAGLAVAGGGITWYVLSQKSPVGTIFYTYR